MPSLTDDDIRSKLKSQGVDADHIAFLPLPDLDQSVSDDIKALKKLKLAARAQDLLPVSFTM